MTGASKILTVSYGTFSCTLEAFDDPFNTMKAIAEYFRDLAAGDRYFGAEPPVPDAAMLHRIAEREIHRRVEAKIQDNGVILRAGDPNEAPSLADLLRPALIDSPADTATESVAARLQRIRAKHAAAVQAAPVVAEAAASRVDVAPLAAAPEDDYTEDEHAEDLAGAIYDATSEQTAEIGVSDQIEDILDAAELNAAENGRAVIDPSDQFADLPEAQDFAPEDFEAQDFAAETFIEAAPLAATVEAKPQDEADFDQFAADNALLANLQSDLPEDVSSAIENAGEPVDMPEDVGAADDAPEDFTSGDVFDDEEEDMLDDAGFDDALLSRLVQDQAPLAETANHTDAFEATSLETSDDLLLSRLIETEVPNLIEPELVEPELIEPDLIEDLDQLEEPEAAPKVEPAPRARARVIRIRRADPVSAAAVVDVAPMAAAAEPSALSDEAEAALQAELAALEAEIRGVAAHSAPVPAHVEPEAKLAEPRRHVEAPAEDEAVNRLMAQANSEMGGEETRRRQSAIAHLKAAVAATEADRIVNGGPAPKTEERLEAYRSDLDRVVRPRRPVAETSTARPSAEPQAAEPNSPARPTPLVLVSTQRIDRAPAATPVADPAAPRVVMPVRPRRAMGSAAALTAAMDADSQPSAHDAATASAADVMQDADQVELDEDDILSPDESDNVFSDATSFEDFADQLGATELSDLLEAAAVYCAEVLQRPEFSRPLVMRQISTLPSHGATNREDYLRGFGTLLRQGRIAKVKRGMFALTDRSPYLAEARKIVG